MTIVTSPASAIVENRAIGTSVLITLVGANRVVALRSFTVDHIDSAGPELNLTVALRNSSSCCRINSSWDNPLCSILLCFFSRD